MDDIKPSKSTKISEIDFKDFIKIISFYYKFSLFKI